VGRTDGDYRRNAFDGACAMSLLYEKIYDAVRKIPRGRVATYAQIAAMAGNPRMCRVVGNALHQNPYFGDVPCHRVINAKGELSSAFVFGGEGVQAAMLEAEGVEVIDGRVDLTRYKMQTMEAVDSISCVKRGAEDE